MLDGIGEVGDALVEPCLAHRLAQELTGRADERLAREVFLIARLLADQHDRRVGGAGAEHGLSGVPPQRAAAAGPGLGLARGESAPIPARAGPAERSGLLAAQGVDWLNFPNEVP